MQHASSRLRARIAQPELLIVPEALNAGTARLVEMNGFEAVYCGGYALSAAEFAMPDHGLINPSEMVELSARIAGAIDIPLVVDADQGGETALNTWRIVRQLESAGVAGAHIEDTRNPKHMKFLTAEQYGPAPLQPVAEMCARLRAAVDARRTDFVVIARTDEIFNRGFLSEAIDRGCAYAEAGADAYFVCSAKPDQIAALAAQVPIPIVDINHKVGDAPGLRIDIFTSYTLTMLLAATQDALDELRAEGRIDLVKRGFDRGRLAEVVGDGPYQALSAAWTKATGEPNG
jgi:2-methylisocitrate lyase-like PEP mutase family enzyme